MHCFVKGRSFEQVAGMKLSTDQGRIERKSNARATERLSRSPCHSDQDGLSRRLVCPEMKVAVQRVKTRARAELPIEGSENKAKERM